MLFMTLLLCPPLAIMGDMDSDLVLHLVALADSALRQQKYPKFEVCRIDFSAQLYAHDAAA